MILRLPTALPPSAALDLRMLIEGRKPAARIFVGQAKFEMRRWARRSGLFMSGDREGYVVLSRNAADARRILDVDRRPGRHTQALGRMLGYPTCCSRRAAFVGDEGIDALSDALARRRFRGPFALPDPGGHREGRALIGHVPCSHVCEASLAIAMRNVEC